MDITVLQKRVFGRPFPANHDYLIELVEIRFLIILIVLLLII